MCTIRRYVQTHGHVAQASACKMRSIHASFMCELHSVNPRLNICSALLISLGTQFFNLRNALGGTAQPELIDIAAITPSEQAPYGKQERSLERSPTWNQEEHNETYCFESSMNLFASVIESVRVSTRVISRAILIVLTVAIVSVIVRFGRRVRV